MCDNFSSRKVSFVHILFIIFEESVLLSEPKSKFFLFRYLSVTKYSVYKRYVSVKNVKSFVINEQMALKDQY